MSSAAAALLDELMGRDRNLQPSDQRTETRWDDKDVCKYFLCGFCPHELFVNTRADLGPCDKIHDESLRKEYEKSTRYQKMTYEDEFFRFLSNLINDVEKRIRRGHQRLALNNQQGSLNGNLLGGKDERVQMLTQKINELVEKAEQLGCEGNVDEAQGVMKLCDQLKEERRQIEENDSGDGPQVKQMEVCEVCGAFLIVGDMKQRIDEHLLGKQHMGYARARATVEKMKEKIKKEAEEREEREARLVKEREEREKEREKEREERNKRLREEREKSKSHRSRSRERSTHKRSSHSRDRDRDRDRHSHTSSRRSRSRDRHRSSRRSRSRDKKSSTRSDSRSKRSPHKEKDKDRHRDRNDDRRRDREDK
ncbi:hypothetical protein SNE40_003709 [Patella caerulea]|uniref:Luc7-like protein 3 n=1 Tax=Patella caerulea TaxID=87958 RepID=A0AAN8Q8X4_PATCE